jgi:hypothetical protein
VSIELSASARTLIDTFCIRALATRFPIDSSFTLAYRMHVVIRALSVSRSTQASRTVFGRSALLGQYGRPKALQQPFPVQRSSVQSLRSIKRSGPRESRSGFSSIAQSPDTIYALSTAAGRAAIAVIRVSGAACLDVRFACRKLVMLANSAYIDIPKPLPRPASSITTCCHSAQAVRSTRTPVQRKNP